jgi:glycosyltransferase involved in cell wall biosynthesis
VGRAKWPRVGGVWRTHVATRLFIAQQGAEIAMSIAYLLPTLPPKAATAEAIAQEIALLQRTFGGETLHVNPNVGLARPLIPRVGFGWHMLPRLYQLAQRVDLFHFFNPDPFPYPFLLALPKPVVYTITAGVEARPNLAYLRRMRVVTVPDERTLAQLQEWGLTNVALQRPGIATHRFTHHPLPLTPDAPLRLLVASAPWTMAQFASKGFDALFAAAQRTPNLHLVLLWRGLLLDEVRQRLGLAGIGAQVTLIDATVDVNATLATVHAAAIFATSPGIIKAYPHSLLDALAAGKPVLLNTALAMSDYVNSQQCGVVAEAVTPDALVVSIAKLRSNYVNYTKRAEIVGQRDFTEAAALDAVAAIYARARQGATPP